MYNPASVVENDTPWDFDIQTDHLIPARRPNLIIMHEKKKKKEEKKRTCKIVDFTVLADYRIKLKESEMKDKYLELVRELKKTMEYESDNHTYCDWCFWYCHQRIIKGTGGLGNERISGDHLN